MYCSDDLDNGAKLESLEGDRVTECVEQLVALAHKLEGSRREQECRPQTRWLLCNGHLSSRGEARRCRRCRRCFAVLEFSIFRP
jgi:hypothetical protein